MATYFEKYMYNFEEPYIYIRLICDLDHSNFDQNKIIYSF